MILGRWMCGSRQGGGVSGADAGVGRERSEAMTLNDDDVVAWTSTANALRARYGSRD